jgi:hypothetical protein
MFDMRSLKKVAELGDLAPRTMAGFKAPDEAGLADGAIPKTIAKQRLLPARARSSSAKRSLSQWRSAPVLR